MHRAVPLVLLACGLLSACSLPDPGAGETVAAPKVLADPVLSPPATCRGYVALTFDDGPTSGTDRLLDVLRRYDLPAVFFNTGQRTQDNQAVAREQAALPGVQLGNHSWSHADLSTLTPEQVRDELARTRELQGQDVTFFRPPFGSADTDVMDQVEQLGMLNVLWTHDSKDFDATSVDEIVERSKGMEDGGILLLHDGNPMTVRAVPRIVEHYYERGLCIGKVAPSTTAQWPAESPALVFNAKAVAP